MKALWRKHRPWLLERDVCHRTKGKTTEAAAALLDKLPDYPDVSDVEVLDSDSELPVTPTVTTPKDNIGDDIPIGDSDSELDVDMPEWWKDIDAEGEVQSDQIVEHIAEGDQGMEHIAEGDRSVAEQAEQAHQAEQAEQAHQAEQSMEHIAEGDRSVEHIAEDDRSVEHIAEGDRSVAAQASPTMIGSVIKIDESPIKKKHAVDPNELFAPTLANGASAPGEHHVPPPKRFRARGKRRVTATELLQPGNEMKTVQYPVACNRKTTHKHIYSKKRYYKNRTSSQHKLKNRQHRRTQNQNNIKHTIVVNAIDAINKINANN